MYATITGLEETLEMAGLISFFYSLLRLLESTCPEIRFSVCVTQVPPIPRHGEPTRPSLSSAAGGAGTAA